MIAQREITSAVLESPMRHLAVSFALLISPACINCDPGPPHAPPEVDEPAVRSASRVEVDATLDAWHTAASRADGERYFALLHPEAIFFGTDATERWDKAAFEAYAQPYFSEGHGWTFLPRDRHVYLTELGRIAWFDERLDNEKYGECRGTGVLVRTGRDWTIVQYNLTIPVPNELALTLVEMIRSQADVSQ
jgi:hypothetical protein